MISLEIADIDFAEDALPLHQLPDCLMGDEGSGVVLTVSRKGKGSEKGGGNLSGFGSLTGMR